MDANTRPAAGDRVAVALAGAAPLVFEMRSGLWAGPDEVSRVRAELGERVPVAVGSGVITDIVRYAAHQHDVDFVSVPTAASMDGYASSVAALQREGVKVTLPARAPRAIFADPRVVAAAPCVLTRSGIGDLLGKATARVDWLISHLLYGERFIAEAADRVLGAMEAVVADPKGPLAGNVTALLDGLVQSGVAIAMVGSSRPASGCEHHASHFWDLLAARGMRRYAAHGLQVGYATRLAMRLQRFAFGGGVERLREPRAPENPLGPEARLWLGEPSEEIVRAVQEKRRFVGAGGSTPDWRRVCDTLAPELDRFERVERALDLAGIPSRPEELELDEQMVRAALRHCTRLRSRYTVIDFLEGQGVLEEAIDTALTTGGARDGGSGGRTRP